MGELSVIGVDVGGTFTDLVLLESDGSITLGKVPSTPENQAMGVMAGLRSVTDDVRGLGRVAHGTTVSTNALIEGRGAPVALVTTSGFGDLLEIGRTRRMLPSLYDPSFVRPAPLVPRPLRVEIAERLTADGVAQAPLNEDAVAAAAEQIGQAVRAVAVCFLHSWRDARHERRASEILRSLMPGIFVTTSAEVVPEFREYERFSTAVLNASLMPVMDHYLGALDDSLARAGCAGRLVTMSSAGGTLDTGTARRLPVRTILSGPAGGVAGALWIAESAGLADFITCDMGGTSTDVCVIEALRPAVVSETAIAGYPLKGMQYDINTVGAGGGSIAYAEADDILKVGPQSAGAEPGPASYGRGGTEPTVTDANLALGRLGTDRTFGGAIKPDRGLAEEAVRSLAKRLGLQVEVLAEGIVRLAVARMAGAVRAITIERGRDPADFALMPFGGAGPMHACDLSEELGIRDILIPVCPGNLSALGLVASDYRQELVRTYVKRLDECEETELRTLLLEQEKAGLDLEMVVGATGGNVRFEHALDMRYARQAFETTIRLPAAIPSIAELRELFLDVYRRLYGQADPKGAIEIVNLRTLVVGVVERPSPLALPPASSEPSRTGSRKLWLRGAQSDWSVYDRARLDAGHTFAGPAVIEEANATTVVLPGWTVTVDQWGNLRLKREGGYP